ncbi:hypothetical protein Ciccas_009693 [Cichlidogyrus casuarinus]|uniref:Uncharacterized protein n=1 Tax=Cichlidogyrus casuarinus TaxID=1844966 RepID=A0ABD2PXR8_9PLAT
MFLKARLFYFLFVVFIGVTLQNEDEETFIKLEKRQHSAPMTDKEHEKQFDQCFQTCMTLGTDSDYYGDAYGDYYYDYPLDGDQSKGSKKSSSTSGKLPVNRRDFFSKFRYN